MALKSYRELIVWQKSMDLVHQVYQETRLFPREEVYGLSKQTRRAAISVPSNIAEGQGRSSTREFIRYLSIAHGSLMELETQLLIAGRLGFLDQAKLDCLMGTAAEVGRMINGLSNSLRRPTTDN